jgi:nitrile hydratase subunit beta
VDGVHDMGGMAGFGPVVPDGTNFHADWERRLFGLARVTRIAGVGSGMFRAAIESMPPAEYLAASYYERWLAALEVLVAEKGVLP